MGLRQAITSSPLLQNASKIRAGRRMTPVIKHRRVGVHLAKCSAYRQGGRVSPWR